VIPETIYSWQTQQWQQLIASKHENRLPHALMLTGRAGLGKKQFAEQFAHTLLCNKADAPCGQCHSCHLIRAKNHPDLMWVEPEQAGSRIKVDQIREVVGFVNETALKSKFRIIIIYPANAMNVNAANALLKTLEEPAPNTLLMLISDQSARLPATINSRCQKILFHAPAQDVALSWLSHELVNKENYDLNLVLKLADHAPLKAKELIETNQLALRQEFYQNLNLLAEQQADPLKLAVHYQDEDIVKLLDLMLVWLQDLMRTKFTNGQADVTNIDYHPAIAKLANVFSSEAILGYADYIKKIYSHLVSSLNLNRQLLLEELFIRWVRYAAC
jgi:DNA polymerase III subunit delta'